MNKGCIWCGNKEADLRFGTCYSCSSRKTKLISAFPATGKSFLSKNKSFKIKDSDSSEFSWIKDENGNNTKERNPEFPQNYIEHIKELIQTKEYDLILISTHKQVRDCLVENNLPFLLVYPKKELKSEYINRYKKRGDNENFINLMDNNWDNFIEELNSQEGCAKEILGKNKFLSNIFDN